MSPRTSGWTTWQKQSDSYLKAINQRQLLIWSGLVDRAGPSRFPCCVLSYFSLVFVVKHSRRWWLHIGGSKMLAPHFKDEIAGLQKWLFLAGFDLFWCSFFIVTHIYGQTIHILQKNCPQMSFPGRKEGPNILHGISRMRLVACRNGRF